MRLIIIFLLGLASMLAMCQSPRVKEPRVNGVCLVNPPREINADKMGEVTRVNAGWVAVIPYGFSRSGEPSVTFDHARQWWGERTKGTCEMIAYAKSHNLKVMLKPHVWVMGEGWTGDYDLQTEDEWKKWEKDYTAYILNHAAVADSLDVELLCIGTEYRVPARERAEFWRGLITSVKQVYSGKITYASNWDNYSNITWWDKVDYIGIDSYFPIAQGDHPSISSIVEGWEPIKNKLATFSQTWNKPILFTEYGFQSVNGATGKHWEVDKSPSNANLQLQADAFEATFQALENEPWWMGGFFWKWHFTSGYGRNKGTEWTPQGKPAEKVIAKWYHKID